MSKVLYLVIPCYNEQEVLPETAGRLHEIMRGFIDAGRVAPESRVLLVDDGSRDQTWTLIEQLHAENPIFAGLKLSRNKGHQNALLAGLMTARQKADVTISLDADLQDDLGALSRFLDEYEQGCDIVYGVRSARRTDTVFKRSSAQGFYKLMTALGADITYNHADYRLMSRRSLDALAQFGEVNLFLRGLIPMIGFKTATVEYERAERFAGESKYPLKKMLAFAADGITSISIKPIRMITLLGLVVFLLSIVALIYSLVSKLSGQAQSGWTSLIVSIWMIGGLQLLSIGVIGEYVGKTYFETKARPKYIIEKIID